MTLSSSFGGSIRASAPPLEVRLLREGISESRHRVHAVVCDSRGRVLMKAGDPQQLSFVRSALKPFQATVFVGSGAADQVGCGERGLAIACASHAGTAAHAREAFRLLWGAEIETEQLQCPVPQGASSPLEHNCSGKHAAFLATCRRLGWSTEGYLQREHPLQQEILKRVAELLGLPAEELLTARDDCGAPTLQLQQCLTGGERQGVLQLPIGQLGQAVAASLHPQQPLKPAIEGRQGGVVERPVGAEAIATAGLELMV